jgi:hypothetical protein
MVILHFFMNCLMTTVQGLIGLVLIVFAFWALTKILRPAAQFPKPVIYRQRGTNLSGPKS